MEKPKIIEELEQLAKDNQEDSLKLVDIEKLVNERFFDKTTEFISDVPIVEFNGKKALSLGNFSVISGKAKAGKGFTLSLIVDGFLNGNEIINSDYSERKKVVHIDTEQSGGHAQRLINTVGRLGGNNDLIAGYWFRGIEPAILVKAINYIIEKHSQDACLFIIDGIRDLSRSGVNDETESTILFNKLLHWTQEHNIHIITVIHQNKGNNDATGYLGGDMVKKAELHLTVTKDKQANTHKIEAEDTRDAPLHPINFMLDNDIIPVIVDEPTKNSTKTRPEQYDLSMHKQIAKAMFVDGKAKNATELNNKIQYDYDIGESVGRKFIEHYLFTKIIKDVGNGKKRQYVLYKDPEIL